MIRFREDVPPSRGAAAAAAFVAAACALAVMLERSGLGVAIVGALARRYRVFAQEPALTWQVYVFLQTFALKLGLILLLALYLAATGGGVVRALGLDRPAALSRRMVAVLLGYAAAAGIVSGLDPLSPAFPVHSFFADALFWGNLVAVFSMIFVAPAAEEVFFRGFLYPGFARSFGAAASMVLTSALFAAAHARAGVEWPTLAVVFVGSLGLTFVRARTGSTRASIVLHTLYNLVILASGVLRYALLGY